MGQVWCGPFLDEVVLEDAFYTFFTAHLFNFLGQLLQLLNLLLFFSLILHPQHLLFVMVIATRHIIILRGHKFQGASLWRLFFISLLIDDFQSPVNGIFRLYFLSILLLSGFFAIFSRRMLITCSHRIIVNVGNVYELLWVFLRSCRFFVILTLVKLVTLGSFMVVIGDSFLHNRLYIDKIIIVAVMFVRRRFFFWLLLILQNLTIQLGIILF